MNLSQMAEKLGPQSLTPEVEAGNTADISGGYVSDLLSDVLLGPVMLAKRKLPLLPHRIRGRAEIRRIFAKCRTGGKDIRSAGTCGIPDTAGKGTRP